MILTIASEDARYVVSYLRPDQVAGLKPGMPVDLRPRAPGRRPPPAVIDRIGPQIEVMEPPNQQLRDPARPQWGLPVRIMIPRRSGGLSLPADLREFGLTPGELIDVTFHPESG